MSSQILKKPLPYLAILTAHLIWGANFVVAKIALSEFPIMSLAFLRFALAAILIIPFLLKLPKPRQIVKSKHLIKMSLTGIFLVTLNISLFYEGLSRTTAINASVLTLVIPVISVIFGWIFLKEKIFWVNLVGIIMGLFGAFVILGLPIILFGAINPTALLGNFLIFISSITFVIGAILSKEMLKIYQPLVVTASIFIIGTITFFIPALIDYLKNPTWFLNLSVLGILGLLYITVLSSVSAIFLMNWGLAKTDVVKTNLFTYIEPAVAATLAVPFLGERISFSFIIGTCLIVLGVYWGTLGKIIHHHIHHKHHRA